MTRHTLLYTIPLALTLSPCLAWSQQPPDAEASAAEVTPAPPSPEVLELRRRIEALEGQLRRVTDKVEESELEKLVKEAEAESKAPEEGEAPEKRNFLWGALALQKLNPEISVSVDILAQVIINDDKFYAGRDDRSSMPIRELGINFQHVLDPYSMFKATLNFAPWPDASAELEEAYITWFGLVPSLSFTVGRFRQQFGVINRWHEHDLDQTGYPMAMDLVLGEDGLVGSGIAIKWFMPPLWAHANELSLEITDGENEALYAGELFSVPSAMAHLKSYWDLAESTYLELGLSGAIGVNNRRGYHRPGAPELGDDDWRRTAVFGADLTLQWNPPQQAKYRSLTWRTEYYFVDKQTPDDLVDGKRQSWGVYSYIDYQLGTRWFAGVRFDAALPTIRDYYEDNDVAWDLVPYLTFWQSEFVYLRLEYRHAENLPFVDHEGALARRTDNRVLLQVDFAAGPHKHEKY